MPLSLSATIARGLVAGLAALCGFTSNAMAADVTFVVHSSIFPGPWSFLRVFNTSPGAGHVTVTLADLESGKVLTTWSGPAIAPGAAAQYAVSAIEAAATSAFDKPQRYYVTLHADFTGTASHVVWRPQAAMTNATACAVPAALFEVNGSPAQAATHVHSSLIDAGYESVIELVNTGAATATARLVIANAATGQQVGIAAMGVAGGGGRRVSMRELENLADLRPGAFTPGISQYVVRFEGAFPGYLQHLVLNTNGAVAADMTPACALSP